MEHLFWTSSYGGRVPRKASFRRTGGGLHTASALEGALRRLDGAGYEAESSTDPCRSPLLLRLHEQLSAIVGFPSDQRTFGLDAFQQASIAEIVQQQILRLEDGTDRVMGDICSVRRVVVTGFTDDVPGSPGYNTFLGQRRAESVRDDLSRVLRQAAQPGRTDLLSGEQRWRRPADSREQDGGAGRRGAQHEPPRHGRVPCRLRHADVRCEMTLASSPLALGQASIRRSVAELQEFVRFPSVSADPRHAADLRRCARWLAGHLARIGLEHARVIPTAPSGRLRRLAARAGRPIVLVYGHYDVQPVDPLPAWTVPPFGAVIRGENLYGRGACDDKGQMFAHVKAIELRLQARGALPVNVKCLFEGEEEIGSPNLISFLRRHRRAMAADVVVVSDTAAAGPDRPALTYALRGALGLELFVRGPRDDIHSGHFGGVVHNPTQALCEIVAGLHTRYGRVAIPGFYDRVRLWPADERAFMARNAPADAAVLRDAGADRGWGEADYTLHERTTIRPALTVNGLTGGYQGPGGKAVIPALASAKLSFRLVPDQDPREVAALFRRHLARITPPTVRCAVRMGLAARPALVDRRHPAVLAAAAACAHGFGTEPAFLRTGGTIPVVSTFKELLGAPTVLIGFAPPGAHIHAPDEHFPLPTFFKAIATCARFLEEVGRTLPARRSVTTASRAGMRRGE